MQDSVSTLFILLKVISLKFDEIFDKASLISCSTLSLFLFLVLMPTNIEVQRPFRIARHSPVSWQQWARFLVLRLEGPPLGRSHNTLNK